MSVPASKRTESDFEAQHLLYQIRRELTQIVIADFGYDGKKYRNRIIAEAKNLDPKFKLEFERNGESLAYGFEEWYIRYEGEKVLSTMSKVQTTFAIANRIFPDNSPVKFFEICARRLMFGICVGYLFALLQEVQYIIETIPVNINRYKQVAKMIDREITLVQGLKKATMKFLVPKKIKRNHGEKIRTFEDILTDLMSNITEAVGRIARVWLVYKDPENTDEYCDQDDIADDEELNAIVESMRPQE